MSSDVAWLPSEIMAPGTESHVAEKMNKLAQALPDVKQIGIYHRKSAPSIINDDILKFYQKLIIQCFLSVVFSLVIYTYFKVGLILNIHQTLLIENIITE